METILYFLFFGALVFFMMRFGCGSHVGGHGHGHGGHRSRREEGGDGSESTGRWTPPAKDTDPVCRMTVETATAKSAVHDGHVYYFCSADCRDKFEAAPATYVKARSASHHTVEHQHGSYH